MDTYDYLFKILVIGDSCVGKSSLVARYTDNFYSNDFISTIGIDFKIRVAHVNDKYIKLQLWDTAGQERFNTITSTYYRGSHAIIIVFDLTNHTSFENVDKWLYEIDNHAHDNVYKILVGTKADLIEQRQVSQKNINELKNRLGLEYIETSAKTSKMVTEVFNDICIKLMTINESNKTDSEQNSKNIIIKNKSGSDFRKRMENLCCH